MYNIEFILIKDWAIMFLTNVKFSSQNTIKDIKFKSCKSSKII